MRRLIRILIPFTLGAAVTFVAWRWFVGPVEKSPVAAAVPSDSPPSNVWTCSMHPQVRMDHKDICPLCGMDLIPVDARQDPWEADDPGTRLVLSEQAKRMARVETMEVQPRELFKDLRTVGRVELDETRVAHIAARLAGRVEHVYADFPGANVRRGEHLVKLYSPELLVTQQEFLHAVRGGRSTGAALGEGFAAAARRRMLLWGITEQQIDELEKSGQAQDYVTVYAPLGGTIIEKNIRPGQYVKEGDLLYTIADLTRVWLVLEVYESELSWVQPGQPVEVTLESDPLRPMTGVVGFIEPVVTNASRTVRVRVIVENQDLRLKPGMYAQAELRVPILPDGKPAPTGLEGKYVCPMHPYEVSERPGLCKQCNMPLELVPPRPDVAPGGKTEMEPGLPANAAASPSTATSEHPKVLAVPADAVLTTGRRQLVYVEKEPGKYQLVEPQLGPRAGDYYPVISGLKQGDRVVTRGNFLLDSQFQITGRVSLLYPEGSTGAHARPDPATGFTPQEQANLDQLAEDDRALAARQKVCPVSGMNLGSMGKPYKMVVEGRIVFLCCEGCEAAVEADPAATLKKLEPTSGNRQSSSGSVLPQGGNHD